MFTALSTFMFTPLGPEFSCCYRPWAKFECTPFLFDPHRCAKMEYGSAGVVPACPPDLLAGPARQTRHLAGRGGPHRAGVGETVLYELRSLELRTWANWGVASRLEFTLAERVLQLFILGGL